jgi:hypothetical protein
MYMCFFLFTGVQHCPLLRQHLANIEKQINQHYGDLLDSDRSMLRDIVQDNARRNFHKI